MKPPEPQPGATRSTDPCRRSGHTELVAFRVVQRDRTTAHVVGPPGQRGARLDQPFHVLADQPLARLAADLAPGHPDVEVNAVLGRLALGHALEVQPRPLAGRVDPGGHLTPVRFRYPGRPGEVLPAGEALRRRLDHVAQGQRPEFGQLLRLGGVEGDLDLGVHAHAPDAADVLPCHSATGGPPAPRSWTQTETCAGSRARCTTSTRPSRTESRS